MCVAKAGTLRNVTLLDLAVAAGRGDPDESGRRLERELGDGLGIGSIPVSSSTVTTHIVFVPDIPGYSTCSMIT